MTEEQKAGSDDGLEMVDLEPETHDTKEPDSPPKKKHRVLIAFLATLLVLGGVFLFALMSHKIIIFRHGFFFGNAERIELEIEANEIEKLDFFSQLKEADLRQSTCFREIAQWGEAHPAVNVLYTVHLPAEISYDSNTNTIDLSKLSPADATRAASDYMVYIKETQSARLDLSAWTLEELLAFHGEYPEITVEGTMAKEDWTAEELTLFRDSFPEALAEGFLVIGKERIALDETSPDASKLTAKDIDELLLAAKALPELTEIDFGREEDGYKKLPAVSAFMKEYPDIKVHYIFTAFEKKINIHTKTLDFNHIEMDDQGEEVREILQYMPKVNFLDMDFCGVDDEHMAAIRDDFPDVKVVWRVWFGRDYSVRTDATKILASAPYVAGELNPENTKSLIYCTEMKYMDLGHNNYLRDIYFVSYMPDLEVLIVMLGNLTDISPLADCKKLEFLEIFSNAISDISPLAECTELKHLNLGYNFAIRDLSPCFGLTKLERLWIGNSTSIPFAQIQEFQELHPDCEVNYTVGDPHAGWRWGNERYALLAEQLGYPDLDYQFSRNDPLYKPHPETDVDMEHVDED
ncbi:MAG: leucine-rich repeat domain-containing protein [Lachnospiraceae bacterium]|nr:leucine-rich repeat domain-containing protein [Lachnospiraceae bacterium]